MVNLFRHHAQPKVVFYIAEKPKTAGNNLISHDR